MRTASVKPIWNTNGPGPLDACSSAWSITVVFVVCAIFAPWIAPVRLRPDPRRDGVEFPKLGPPVGEHWFGTNDQFYDICRG